MCYFLLLFLFAIPLSVFAQTPTVPLNHSIYSFIERLETRGVINGLHTGFKPFTNPKVIEILTEINEVDSQNPFLLSSVEKKQFERYKSEFIGSSSGSSESITQKVKEQLFKSGAVYRWEKDDTYINFRILLKQGLTFYSADSIVDSKPARFSGPGGIIDGKFKNIFGFYIRSRDVIEKKYLEYSYIGQNGPRRARGASFISGYAGKGTANYDETEAYMNFGNSYLVCSFGKQFVEWGRGHWGSTFLSATPPTYDNAYWKIEYGPFRFSSLFGFPLSYPPVVEREYTVSTSEKDSTRKILSPKYIVAHRLEVNLINKDKPIGINFGVGEIIIYGERGIELGYLLPFNFYRSQEHYLGDRDNAAIELDSEISLFKFLKIYNEIFIDDMSTRDRETWNDNRQGYLIGSFFSFPPSLITGDIRIEYVRINPWVYTHFFPINKYKNYDSILGHWIGPNSDLVAGEINYYPYHSVKLTVDYQSLRHGEDAVNSEKVRSVGGNVDRSHNMAVDGVKANFLEGILQKQIIFGGSIKYELFTNTLFSFSYHKMNLSNIKQNGIFIPTLNINKFEIAFEHNYF